MVHFLFFFFLSWFSATNYASTKEQLLHVPTPVQVKVTVVNQNWVDTISICNTSTTAIPLQNIEFDFNFAAAMPSNIWGNPWAAWKLTSQTGAAVVLTGGTAFTPDLQPDPNCTNPLTIQFSAGPDVPLPTGPFVFKAEGGTPPPPQGGELDIKLNALSDTSVPSPEITVSGPGGTNKQVVMWGSTWQLKNLTAGTYTISGAPVDNGTQFYALKQLTADVVTNTVMKKSITYKPVTVGTVTVTLVKAPSEPQTLTFTGASYTFSKSITNGMTLTLPKDTYNVTGVVPGYKVTIKPNPLSVPSKTALTVTYTKDTPPPPTGGYTTNNGMIVDPNGTAVTFKGVNWFGFNTGNHVLHGLWQADFLTMLAQIKSIGFNAVRIPFQFDFVLDPTIKPNGISTTCGSKPCNTDIPQDSALNALQYIVKKFTDNGIYVLLDDHYEDDTYVNNQAGWQAGWKKIAQLFSSNPLVGYDLWNEPDSHNLKWDAATQGIAWATALDNAASGIYAIDQKKLIFIEGVAQGALFSNWGDGFATDDATVQQNISNPKAFFTKAASSAYLNQLVVSPHAYGPDGTNNQGPDHSDQTKAFADWSRLNGYLLNNFLNVNNTSKSGFCIGATCHLYPIAFGEFGGKFDPADPFFQKDTATLVNLAKYITKLGEGKAAPLSWFYWDWNPNSGNTGGILKDDWATVDCNKVNYLKTNLGLIPAAGICP